MKSSFHDPQTKQSCKLPGVRSGKRQDLSSRQRFGQWLAASPEGLILIRSDWKSWELGTMENGEGQAKDARGRESRECGVGRRGCAARLRQCFQHYELSSMTDSNTCTTGLSLPGSQGPLPWFHQRLHLAYLRVSAIMNIHTQVLCPILVRLHESQLFRHCDAAPVT